MMDFKQFKQNFRQGLRPLVLSLDRLGMSPLTVSLLGLLITAVSGWMIAKGNLFGGALVFLVGSGFDMLDGDLARLQGTVSKRGAFLDSCFDRLGEAFLFAGLTWHFASQPYDSGRLPLVLITATVVGSLTTSYVRARAEGVGETCFVGFLQRTERVILLTVGLIFGSWALVPILAFLAVATLGTTVQRIVHVAAKLPGPGIPQSPSPEDSEAAE
jgi:phosphatidylinositol phosphate synthase